MASPLETDDALWSRLEPAAHIEKKRKESGRPSQDPRSIFNGLIRMARTGSRWSQISRCYGAKSTIFDRFKVWSTEGHLAPEYDELLGIDWERHSADGCTTKAPLENAMLEGIVVALALANAEAD